jgi:hypoxanthine phosphoribosyltransferase
MKDRDILFTAEAIQRRVAALGEAISKDYEGRQLIFISMLKGSLYFLADLTRAVTIPSTFDMLGVSTGKERIHLTRDVTVDLTERDVIVVEEIVRTGLTTNFMIQHLETKQPKSIALAALLVNPDQQLIDLPLRYTGFTIGWDRVVGYGMDYREHDRSLPYIAILDRKRYAEATVEQS